MQKTLSESWGPVYDLEALKDAVTDLVSHIEEKGFYLKTLMDSLKEYECVQGDIISVDSGIPFIDDNSEPTVMESNASGFWLVLSNTCDITRVQDDVEWMQIVPISVLGEEEAQQLGSYKTALTSYQVSRVFYLPSWNKSRGINIANFLRQVHIDKRALTHGNVKVVARLNRESWWLLHSCLVRFYARQDGRAGD